MTNCQDQRLVFVSMCICTLMLLLPCLNRLFPQFMLTLKDCLCWQDELKFLQAPRFRGNPNLVKVIGCCREGRTLGIVYDLNPQDTLHNFIIRGAFFSHIYSSFMQIQPYIFSAVKSSLCLGSNQGHSESFEQRICRHFQSFDTNNPITFCFACPDDFKWLQRVKTALALACLLNYLHDGNSSYMLRNFDPAHIAVDQVQYFN